MKLYDELIIKFNQLVPNNQEKKLELDDAWEEVSDRSMILRSDMAFELGADRLPGIGLTLITGSDEFVLKDNITLIGEDISKLEGDAPYARIAIVKVDDEAMGEGNILYKAIRNLEFTKYHFYPEGFMIRVSSTKQRESVRVSKEALKKGLSFAKTGTMLINAFKKQPNVKAVKVIYITDPDFDYASLRTIGYDADDITQAIDHILKNVPMDCKACSLQKICDEIEGLRELHFQGNITNE